MRWESLNPVQVECIHAIIQTDVHLVVTAPTAGGKTEAAFLPVLSRIASKPDGSIRALYIGPLKALINDQFSRLDKLCEHCQVPVHRWHGDVSATEKMRTRTAPGGVLLITPESIEAMFLHRGREVPRLFANLDYVIIDELHAFLENVRGVHLQSLLSRISRHARCRPRLIGLSATLGDYSAAQKFLAPDNPETVRIIESPQHARDVRLGVRAHLSPEEKKDKDGRVVARRRLAPGQWAKALTGLDTNGSILIAAVGTDSNPKKDFYDQLYQNTDVDPIRVTTEFANIAADICRNFREGANLIFGNAKRVLELVADTCHQTALQGNWPNDPFYVHHGSLSKDERETVEARLKQGTDATAFCSSTLEMGIDIGSVRAVGQIDPPWSVSSLVQRLGRSGRRAGEVSTMRIYTRDKTPTENLDPEDLLFPDLLRSIALVRLMIQKWLEPPDTTRLHLSTLVHQLLSHLRQTGGMKPGDLHEVLLVSGPFRAVSQVQFIALLRGLREHELVDQMADGTIILGLKGESITHDRAFYAAFQSTEELTIMHGDHHLGMLAADLVPPAGENLILGGRRWEVVEISSAEKRVQVKRSTNPKLPYFRGSGGELGSRVVDEVRKVLFDPVDSPPWLDSDANILLNAARDVGGRWKLGSLGVISIGNNVVWFPWTGTKTLRTLALLAKHHGVQATLGQISICYQNTNMSELLAHLSQVANTRITAEELSPLLAVKQFEKFDEYIPEALLDAANARERIDISGASHVAAKTVSSYGRR